MCMCQVCGGPALSLFRYEELELLVCGLPHYNFAELEKAARYEGGYNADHPTITTFWKIIHHFSLEQKKRFLLFTTGSDRCWNFFQQWPDTFGGEKCREGHILLHQLVVSIKRHTTALLVMAGPLLSWSVSLLLIVLAINCAEHGQPLEAGAEKLVSRYFIG